MFIISRSNESIVSDRFNNTEQLSKSVIHVTAPFHDLGSLVDGLPPVVHSLASVHRALDQLNHGPLLEVLGLLVLFSETLEGGPQDSVDKTTQPLLEPVGLLVVLATPALWQHPDLSESDSDHSCLRLQQSAQEGLLDVDHSAVGSELADDFSQLLRPAVLQQILQQFHDELALALVHAVLQLHDSTVLAPPAERLAQSLSEHAEQFDESLLLERVVMSEHEGVVGH